MAAESADRPAAAGPAVRATTEQTFAITKGIVWRSLHLGASTEGWEGPRWGARCQILVEPFGPSQRTRVRKVSRRACPPVTFREPGTGASASKCKGQFPD